MAVNNIAPLWRDWAMSPRDVAPQYRPFWKSLWGYVPAGGIASKKLLMVRPDGNVLFQENTTCAAVPKTTQRGMATQMNGNDADVTQWVNQIPGTTYPGSVFSTLLVANIRRTSPVHLSDIHLQAYNATTTCWTLDTRSVTPNGLYGRIWTNSTTVPENVYTGCGTTGLHAIGLTATGAQAGDTFVGFCDGVKGTPLSLAGSRSGGNTGAAAFYIGTASTGRVADSEYLLQATWSRALSDALMVKLTTDPFGPFRRTRKLVGWAPTNISVAVTGNAATGAVGTPSWLWGVLTGVVGTGSIGALAIELLTGPSGVTGSTAIGSFNATVITPVSAVVGTSGVGSMTSVITSLLTGNAATGSVGTFSLIWGVLSGVGATGFAGDFSPLLTFAPTGVSGSGTVGTLAEIIAVATSGVSGTGTAAGLPAVLIVSPTGVFATGTIGILLPTIGAIVVLTGVGGAGGVGTFLVATGNLLGGVRAVMSSGSRYSGTPSSFEGSP